MTHQHQKHTERNPASISADFPLMDCKAVANLIGLSPRTLEGFRVRGGGPKFVKISGRTIRYRMADVRTWVEQRIVANTSEEL